MGFGSYDESEQENQAVEPEADHEGVSLDGTDHTGEISYEMDSPTEDLVDQLQDIKDDGAD